MSLAGELTGHQPRALATALELLEAVARAGPGVTAAELSAATGVPRATAYRVLNLLVAEELVVRLPGLSGFALGRRVAGLVDAAAPVRLPTSARAELARLRAGVRAAVHLVLVRGEVLRCADADPDAGLALEERTFTALLPAGAAGRVLAGDEQAVRHDDPVPGAQTLAVAVRSPEGDLLAVLLATAPASASFGVSAYAQRLRGCARALGPLLG